MGEAKIDGRVECAQNYDMPTLKAENLVKKIEQTVKIDAKEAVKIATRYFGEFFPHFANANVMLEEIEEGDDGKCWLITLGYDVKRPLSGHQKIFQPEISREYKTFKINNTNGEVASMKIRKVS